MVGPGGNAISVTITRNFLVSVGLEDIGLAGSGGRDGAGAIAASKMLNIKENHALTIHGYVQKR